MSRFRSLDVPSTWRSNVHASTFKSVFHASKISYMRLFSNELESHEIVLRSTRSRDDAMLPPG
eukprot:1944581-Prymnesium_polylepis.2